MATQKNPGGQNYEIVNYDNFSDVLGGQQRCETLSDFWKALTAIKPGDDHVPCAQSFHDTLAFLASEFVRSPGWVGYKQVVPVLLPPAALKESGKRQTESRLMFNSEEYDGFSITSEILNSSVATGGIVVQNLRNVLPVHLYRGANGQGTLNVSIPIYSGNISDFAADSAETIKQSLIEELDSSFIAFSPLADSQSSSNDATLRDTNSDGIPNYTGNEYNKVLLFLLLKTYWRGLISAVGTSTIRSYTVNPFTICVTPGVSFIGSGRTAGIHRYLGRETELNGYAEDFDLDNYLANELVSSGTPTEKLAVYEEFVASLDGSAGRTRFTQDSRVSATYFSVPIVVPILLGW